MKTTDNTDNTDNTMIYETFSKEIYKSIRAISRTRARYKYNARIDDVLCYLCYLRKRP